MYIEKIRQSITIKAAFITFSIILLATIIRPLVIEQSVVFTYIGVINSLIMGGLFFYLKVGQPKPWHPLIFVLIGLLVLLPIMFISGGINSQFAYLLPIVPIFVALISEPKYTWATAIFILGLLLVLYIGSDTFPDYTNEVVSHNKTVSRAIWLCLSVLFSTTFCIEFNRLNRKLGNKLSAQAEIDGLTGIHNRRSVMNFLQLALDEAKSKRSLLTVMMIDLDHFKSINDRFGHIIGDRCLISVAQVVRNHVRHASDLAGRFGGEEFIVILQQVEAKQAADIADKIRLAIEQEIVSVNDSQDINLTASIGVCTRHGEQLNTIEEFIELADKALYLGKKAGRNRVVLA